MRRVVVATNDSAASRRAVVRAAELFPGSELVVAMVVPDGPDNPTGERSPVRTATHRIAVEAAREALRLACEVVGPRAQALVLTGEPVEALCELARDAGAGAIVVGSLGPGALAQAWGGSIGDQLQRDAPCPVLELGRPH